MKLELDDAKGG